MSVIARPVGLFSRANMVRLAIYLAGCLVFSAGASLFIQSHLGADPLDVLSLGLREHFPITIGVAQALIAVVCIAVWSIWNRRRPVLTPFVTFFLCGSLIDLALLLDLSVLPPVAMLAAAAVLCAYGSALIIMSGIGIRAVDLVVLSLVKHCAMPFWLAKVAVEFVLLGTGFLLGGPVGIGTVVFLVFVDGLIQPMMNLNQRVLNMRNHGLAASAGPSRPTPQPAGGVR